MQKKWWAAGELLLATTIWGFGFTASIWALTAFDSISISVIRFGTAFAFGLLALSTRKTFRSEINFTNLKKSLLPGLFLGATLCLQTWGLEFTTATNSGFITTLYVVIVPIIEGLVYRKRLSRLHSLWVFLALIGTSLMIQLHFDSFNKGDLLTLLCAFTAAFQILAVGHISKTIKSAFAFNTFQSLWAALASLLFWPFYGRVLFQAPSVQAAIGLFSLVFLSTLLAFFLQIKAQKILSPSISAIIFLLESPFAAAFAIFFLHERLTLWQTAGGVLIFVAAFQATKGDAK